MFYNSTSVKSALEKALFSVDNISTIVWLAGVTMKIKLHFQIYPAQFEITANSKLAGSIPDLKLGGAIL